MSIRPSDILFYGGGECLQKFGVPFMGMNTRQRTVTFTNGGGGCFDRNGILRQSSANRLRVDWVTVDGVLRPALLIEPARTNVVLWNRDLTNAAWVKTNCTPLKDQTGVDGVTSSASKITASAGNATCLQAITLGSSARFQSCYIKRVTGSGTIEMTTDNGSTWTAVTVTAAWTRVTIPTQTLANPTVGFRIVTNGDAVAIDFVQNETGVCTTSPIATTTAEVTRSADTLYVPFQAPPQEMSIYAKIIERGTLVSGGQVVHVGSATAGADPRIGIESTGSFYRGYHDTGSASTSTLGEAPALTDVTELLLTAAADGTPILSQSIAAATATTGTGQTAKTFATAWADKRLYAGSEGTADHGVNQFLVLAGARGTRTLDEFRSLFAWRTA